MESWWDPVLQMMNLNNDKLFYWQLISESIGVWFSMDESTLESPDVLVLQRVISTELPGGIAHHVFGQLLMERASDIDVLARGISKVTTYRLSVTLGDVLAWAMEQVRVEEYDVSLLHGEMDFWSIRRGKLFHAPVGFVHTLRETMINRSN